jgi:hypothetical protein
VGGGSGAVLHRNRPNLNYLLVSPVYPVLHVKSQLGCCRFVSDASKTDKYVVSVF